MYTTFSQFSVISASLWTISDEDVPFLELSYLLNNTGYVSEALNRKLTRQIANMLNLANFFSFFSFLF